MFLQRPQATFVTRFHEFVHESGGRREGDTVAFLTSSEPEGEGNVSLAGSGRPKGSAVLSLLDPFAPCQFQNQRLVEGGLRGEVEGVEALDLRKAREANTTFDVPALAVDALQFAQSKQKARVVGAILG